MSYAEGTDVGINRSIGELDRLPANAPRAIEASR